MDWVIVFSLVFITATVIFLFALAHAAGRDDDWTNHLDGE